MVFVKTGTVYISDVQNFAAVGTAYVYGASGTVVPLTSQNMDWPNPIPRLFIQDSADVQVFNVLQFIIIW